MGTGAGAVKNDSILLEHQISMGDRLEEYNVQFSGCQILQQSGPFHLIRRYYGDINVCIVVFHGTTLLAEQAYNEYCSLLLRPMIDPDPSRIRCFIPNTVWVDARNTGWMDKIAHHVLSSHKKTLIIMESIVFEDAWKLHKERIETILDAIQIHKEKLH